MPSRPSRTRFWTCTALACCVASVVVALGAATTAQAAQELPLQITSVDASDAPIIRVGLTGGEDPTTGEVRNVVLLEDGERNTTGNVYAGQVGVHQQYEDSVVMLAVDASLSMKGERIEQAMRAADVVLRNLHRGDRVGLMTFGGTTRVLVPPTSDLGRVRRALRTPPELSFGTVLYDSIVRSTRLLPATLPADRMVVVLTDGEDVGSAAKLDEAAAAARDAGVKVIAVGLGVEGRGEQLLPRLVSSSGGSYHPVEDASDLTRLYGQLSVSLLRTHWVEYHSMRGRSRSVELTVDVPGQDPVTTTVTTPPPGPPTPLVPESARPQPVVARDPWMPIPGGAPGAVLVAVPVGIALALAWLTWARMRRRRRLDTLVGATSPRTSTSDVRTRRIRLRLRRERRAEIAPLSRSAGPLTRLVAGRRAGRAAARILEQARVTMSIEQLAWVCMVVATAGAVTVHLFARAAWAGAVGGAIGLLLVPLVIVHVAKRRRREFERQVPNALGAIATALRAGHGFDQALAAVAADGPEPIAGDLRRAIEEARLGRPIEESLEAIAERYQSREFDFVVTTVAIQRQIGGSLAEILEIVTGTLRQRLTFRRKVLALTSMGRMSVWVLVGLPPFIAVTMSLIDPDFLDPLLETPTGHLMLGGAVVSMVIGTLLCRRIVDVRV